MWHHEVLFNEVESLHEARNAELALQYKNSEAHLVSSQAMYLIRVLEAYALHSLLGIDLYIVQERQRCVYQMRLLPGDIPRQLCMARW